LHILFLGDIFGKPGRRFVGKMLPSLEKRYKIDFTIANGENAAGGLGLTPATVQELFDLGIDVLTSGNHIWDKKIMLEAIDTEKRVLRPANFSPASPGKGSGVFQAGNFQIGVLNLSGRLFMPPIVDCPFTVAQREIDTLLEKTPLIIVDFHAEATSEKLAMGWLLRNKASAVIGTHTHVQTADEKIYPGKAAYITDAGMVGPYTSILGLDPDEALGKLMTGLPMKWKIAGGKCILCGVVITLDESSGKAIDIQRIHEVGNL